MKRRFYSGIIAQCSYLSKGKVLKFRPFIIALLLFIFSGFTIIKGQVNGDYRTNATGIWNWTTTANWQKMVAGSWVASGEFPGELTSAGSVFILNNSVVNITTVIPNPVAGLSINGGDQISSINITATGNLNVTGNTLLNSNSNNDYKYIVVAGTFTSGSLTATSLGDNQDAFLEIQNGGSAEISGNITMSGSNLRTYIRFSGNGTLTTGGSITGGTITSAINGGATSPTTGKVHFNGSATQNIGNYGYYNLELSGSNKSLQTNSTVSGNLIINGGNLLLNGFNLIVNTGINLINGNIILGNNNITLSGTISGGSSNSYIETSGSGFFIKSGNAAAIATFYPTGSGGLYAPVDLSGGFTASGNGTFRIRTVSGSLSGNYLSRYWNIQTTGFTGISANPSFTYNQPEVQGLEMYYKAMYNPASVWQEATGTATLDEINNVFTINGSNLSNGNYTAGYPAILYSYQTGNWDNASTWTTDPGGTTQLGSSIPGPSDRVVILPGRTVSLSSNVSTSGLDITINAGGFLNMDAFSFTSNLNALRGEGTLKLASAAFPAVTTNEFINAGGGTTEYNNSANFNLLTSQTTYNNLTFNLSTNSDVATQLNNLTINGNLLVKKGTFRINDNTAARRTLIIRKDISVESQGSIIIGTGVTNTVTNTSGINGGTAPFINYYISHSHRIELYGNFTNNGTVRFTNLLFPVYNSFPPTTLGTNTGMATVFFLGASNNTLTCNGTTDFYNLVLDKGVDQTFQLTLYSSAYQNFRLFGANNSAAQNSGNNLNPLIKKALWIRTGTLVLQGLTAIPSLTEGTDATAPGSNYIIPGNGALQVNGTDVIVQSTADDYREVNAAYTLACPSDAAAGITQNINNSFTIIGKLQVDNGYFSTKESGGLVASDYSAGQLIINGGTVDTKQLLAAGPTSGVNAYIQTGGTLFLRGRFQRTPATFGNASDLSNAPVNTTRANMTFLDSNKGSLSLNSTGNIFSVSGGTIEIADVTNSTNGKAVDIFSSVANINVTGGTLGIIPTTGTNDADASNYLITSTSPFGNFTINRSGGSSNVMLNNYYLKVLKNFNLESGTFNANNLNVNIGGNFTIANGTTYTTGTNKTVFDGLGNQVFTINTASALPLHKLHVNKSSSDILNFAGSQGVVNIADSLLISGGRLNDNGKTIQVSGNILNSGTHFGTGKIVLISDNNQYISGNGSGSFTNIELNKPAAGNVKAISTSDFAVEGTLTFSGTGNKQLYIQGNKVSLGEDALITGANANRYIQTNGQAGDGGLTKTFSVSSASFTFPIGAPSTRHAGVANYSPASISINGSPASYGSVTVVPVGIEHPNTTIKGRSLTYYWRVKTGNGFNLGSATVSQSFVYSENDLVTGTGISENEYVPARYNVSTYTWTKGTSASIDGSSNTIGNPWLANTSFIEGDYTAGDDNPTSPFGTPTKYYSRINGTAPGNGLWSNVNTWSLTGHTGASAGSVPGASDIVIIGGKDSVYLATNNTTIIPIPEVVPVYRLKKVRHLISVIIHPVI
ncbi:MAG: hypothetical protein HC905_00745 [Bacteroidales bacterium]|nr:hypothetical protein [Bacteroidales bacterium]